MALRIAICLALAAAGLLAQQKCACDAKDAESLKARECSLCVEAEKQPGEEAIFFLKDVSPRKPNRMLALPRKHSPGMHRLRDLSPKERAALWNAAIGKSKELWGDGWGVAYNGDKVRTQCHVHIHIGKLMKGVETGKFVTVDRAAQIPAPLDGTGLWVHPAGKRIHVHLGEQTCETVLLR